ncbi:MAG: cytochrome c [Ignavibacteria bacterium]|nr:cytochrome c [Ignavibacteria bacterium]
MHKRHRILAGAVLGVAVLVFVALWAGNDFQPLRSTEPPFQLRYDMQYQQNLRAQQPSSAFADRKSMRDHVPGTLPRDGEVFTDTSWEQTEARLRDPLPPATPALLARGRNRFNSFCAPCHSANGQDTTEVVRKGMQKPPNLAAAKAKGYSDAHLFYIISRGQNIMPGYADKLVPADRWAVIRHVRELQKQPLRYPDPALAKTDTSKRAPATAQAGK